MGRRKMVVHGTDFRAECSEACAQSPALDVRSLGPSPWVFPLWSF